MKKPIPVWGKFISGQCYTYKYDPKHKDILSFYDKKPLIIFVSYIPEMRLLQGLNMHFLTVPQRRFVYKFLSKHSHALNRKRPLGFDWWSVVRKSLPHATICWRRYIPSRVKLLEHIPYRQWEDDMVNSDTAEILGVTTAEIQRMGRELMKRYSKPSYKPRYRR